MAEPRCNCIVCLLVEAIVLVGLQGLAALTSAAGLRVVGGWLGWLFACVGAGCALRVAYNWSRP